MTNQRTKTSRNAGGELVDFVALAENDAIHADDYRTLAHSLLDIQDVMMGYAVGEDSYELALRAQRLAEQLGMAWLLDTALDGLFIVAPE